MLKQQREEKMQAMESSANKLKSYTFSSDYEILLKDTREKQLHIHEYMCFILKNKYNIPMFFILSSFICNFMQFFYVIVTCL